MLSLVGLFIVLLLIEVQKQQGKTSQKRVKGNGSIKSVLAWLIVFCIGGIYIYWIVKYNLSPFTLPLISFAPAALWGTHQEQTQQQKQRYQRVPVIPPKRNQPITNQPKSSRPEKLKVPDSLPFNLPSQQRTLQPNHPLRIKLLAMVGGDVRTVDRLLQHCQKNNPGMNIEWYFDKVICDLIRDRR